MVVVRGFAASAEGGKGRRGPPSPPTHTHLPPPPPLPGCASPPRPGRRFRFPGLCRPSVPPGAEGAPRTTPGKLGAAPHPGGAGGRRHPPPPPPPPSLLLLFTPPPPAFLPRPPVPVPARGTGIQTAWRPGAGGGEGRTATAPLPLVTNLSPGSYFPLTPSSEHQARKKPRLLQTPAGSGAVSQSRSRPGGSLEVLGGGGGGSGKGGDGPAGPSALPLGSLHSPGGVSVFPRAFLLVLLGGVGGGWFQLQLIPVVCQSSEIPALAFLLVLETSEKLQ